MKDFTVFISYSHDDGRDVAKHLNELITQVFPDISVFWDSSLFAGEYLWDKLHEEVRHCDLFLYLVSDLSTKMPSGCIREFSWARFYEKHVVPCILSTYSDDPTDISGLPELSKLLYMDLRKGIENCTGELAKLYGTIYESVVNASPITQFHRKEMMMLYEILGRLSDEKNEGENFRVGAEVYEQGYEFDYDYYPRIEGRVSQALSLEVIDILDMMDKLQRAWKEFSDQELKRIKDETDDTVEYLVNNIGFWANEESDHLNYMRFLNERKKFTDLNYVSDSGNSHMPNLPSYRAMLQEYSQIKHDASNDFYRGRYQLSANEVVRILKAQRYISSHPL